MKNLNYLSGSVFAMAMACVLTFASVSKAEGQKTLCEKYGAALPKVVDDFVAKTAGNPDVDFFRNGKFKNIDVPHFKKHVVNFFADALGCTPKVYKGRTMKKTHKGMKVTQSQFDAMGADLKAVLEADGVTPEDVTTIMGVVGGTAKDIVEIK